MTMTMTPDQWVIFALVVQNLFLVFFATRPRVYHKHRDTHTHHHYYDGDGYDDDGGEELDDWDPERVNLWRKVFRIDKPEERNVN